MREIRRKYKGTEPAGWKKLFKEKAAPPRCHKMDRKSRQKRPEDLPYYHNGEASSFSRILSTAGIGSYLLRSASYPGSYALLVNTGKVIQKFLIETTDQGRYRLAPRTFGSIDEIIHRYSLKPIADNVCLLRAALSEKSGCISAWPSATISSSDANYSTSQQSSISDLVHNGNQTDLSATLSTSHIVASVQALRKSREEKHWKTCYIALIEDFNGNCELSVSDNEQALRSRMSFLLDSCHMYHIHRSVYGRDGCVYIGQHDTDAQSTFLCFRPAHTYLAWIALLRPRVLWLRAAIFNIGRFIEAPRVSEIALLHISINKFVSDSMLRPDSHYSASVMLDGIRVFCSRPYAPSPTRSQPPLTIVFDASYVASSAPTASCSVQMVLSPVMSSQNGGVLRRVSPRAIAATSRQFFLQGNDDVEDTPENGFWVRVKRIIVRVLPTSQYAPLLSLIKQDGFVLCEWVWNKLPAPLKSQFASSLWILYLTRTKELSELVEAVLKRTIIGCSSTPLRSDSFCTALLGVGLRFAVGAQLESQFDSPPISTLLAKKSIQTCDVDLLVEVMVQIAGETAAHRILSLVASVSRNIYPDDPFVTMKILACLFVLRFANPVLIQSREGQGGNQLAKLIQSAANCACSPNLDEDNCSMATSLFRKLFESIYVSDVDCLVGVETEWSCDSMAVLAHLIATVLSIDSSETSETEDPCPVTLTPQVLRILQYHESDNTSM